MTTQPPKPADSSGAEGAAPLRNASPTAPEPAAEPAPAAAPPLPWRGYVGAFRWACERDIPDAPGHTPFRERRGRRRGGGRRR